MFKVKKLIEVRQWKPTCDPQEVFSDNNPYTVICPYDSGEKVLQGVPGSKILLKDDVGLLKLRCHLENFLERILRPQFR